MREGSGSALNTNTGQGTGAGAGLGGVGVRQRDLIIAGEAEVAKMQGGNFDIISKLFT
jgi:hypothetical protein